MVQKSTSTKATSVTKEQINSINSLIKKNEIKIVDLKFNDLPGLWQHFSIPASELVKDSEPDAGIWAEGIGFDGSSIRGFQKIQESDMVLYLDASTAVTDPVCEVPTLSIICNVFDPVTKAAYTRDPRFIAQKAEQYLKSTGIADESFWGRSTSSSFSMMSGTHRPSTRGSIRWIPQRGSGTRAGTSSPTSGINPGTKKAISRYRPTTRSRM